MVLTCSTTDGDIMNWFYNGMSLDTAGFIPSDPINTTRDVMVSGFIFSLVLTSRMPEFASTLSFRADAAMNGHNVSCTVGIPLSGGGVDIRVTTHNIILRIIAGKCWKFSYSYNYMILDILCSWNYESIIVSPMISWF